MVTLSLLWCEINFTAYNFEILGFRFVITSPFTFLSFCSRPAEMLVFICWCIGASDRGWHGEEEYECHIIYRSLFMKVPSQRQGHRGQTGDVIQSPSTDGHIEMNRTTLLVRDFPSEWMMFLLELSENAAIWGRRRRRAPAPPRRTRAYLFTACFALIS